MGGAGYVTVSDNDVTLSYYDRYIEKLCARIVQLPMHLSDYLTLVLD